MVLHSPGCGRVGRRRHSTFVGYAPDFRVRGISHFWVLFCVVPARGRGSVCLRSGAVARAPRALVVGAVPLSGGVASGPVLPAGPRTSHAFLLPVGAVPRTPSSDLAPSAGSARSRKRARRAGARGVRHGSVVTVPRERCVRRGARRALLGRFVARGGRTVPPPASVTSTARGLRRTVSGFPADLRTLDAVDREPAAGARGSRSRRAGDGVRSDHAVGSVSGR